MRLTVLAMPSNRLISTSVGRESSSLVKRLLKHGANINAKNKDGGTAVMIAHTFGHKKLVDMLLAAGAQ